MEMNGQLHAPATLPPYTYLIGSWLDLRADLDAVEKRKVLYGFSSNLLF
jgi:hypothetical protein